VTVSTALVTGFGNMLFNTLWETTLQQRIPPASLSRVSAAPSVRHLQRLSAGLPRTAGAPGDI
jgi:hypothetical protein